MDLTLSIDEYSGFLQLLLAEYEWNYLFKVLDIRRYSAIILEKGKEI